MKDTTEPTHFINWKALQCLLQQANERGVQTTLLVEEEDSERRREEKRRESY
jgi:hypothetical protein